jgi:hypothetical protein
MTRRAKLQNAFPRGVLDPDLYERIDLAHYYLAVADARNQIVSPQGGMARRPGSVATRQRLRRRLEPVTLTAGMVTAPNGGTIASLIDQDPATVFTTAAIAGSPFIIAQIDLGAPMPIVFADVIAFRDTGANGRDDAFAVEWWDGGTWQPFAGSGDPSLSPRKALRGAERTRRFGTRPGAHPVAQLFRLAFYGGGDGVGAFTVRGLRLWREQSTLSPVQILDFAKTSTESYELVLTDRNIDVFRSGAYYASIPIPVGAELNEELVWAQSLDTLLLFHEDVDPQLVLRQGAHDEWNAAPAAFTDVPALTTSTAFSGDQNEEQELIFSGLTPGDAFVLFLGDAVTVPIIYSDTPTLLTDLAAAIEALPGVNADNIEVTLRAAAPLTIRISFVNLNGARRWPRLSPVVLEPSSLAVAATVVQRGVDADGPLMGATTGWPRAGVFVSSRLLLGGFRAAPSTYAFSRVGLYFDFENDGSPITADLGIVNSIDSDKVESIQRVFVGTHVQIFTEEGEWYLENRVIDATQPLNLVLSTSYGVAPHIPPAFVQGSTLFVQSGGEVDGVRQPDRVLRDMIFDFADRNNYTAEPLSLLAPHLLTDIADLAHRPGAHAKEASLVLLLNRDGGFAMLTLLRSQDVTAMTPGSTAGRVAAIGADKKRNLWWAVEREAGGVAELWLERLDDGAYLDAQVTITEAPSAVITGLDHLDGRDDVWVYADGDLLGPFTVAGAAITLARPASEKIVGIAVPLSGRTLPLREKLQEAQPFRPPVRVFLVEWSLRDCGPFEMRANGGAWVEVPIRHFDGKPIPKEATGEEPAGDLLDVPLLGRLYSGRIKMEGLAGWTRDGLIEWRQVKPAPFKMRGIRYEVSYR